MYANICEYSKNHWSVHFKWEDLIIYELQLHNVVLKRYKDNLSQGWLLTEYEGQWREIQG